MTELFLNGKKVVLFDDFALGITMLNPVFNEAGSFSYPMGIPYKVNELQLGYPGRVNNKVTSFEYEFILRVDNQTLLTGNAESNGDIEDDEFPLILLSGNSVFEKKIKGTLLSELYDHNDNEIFDTIAAMITHLNSNVLKDGSEAEYATPPIYDVRGYYPNKAYSTSDQLRNYINEFDPVDNTFIQREDSPRISLCMFLNRVMERIAAHYGFSIRENHFNLIPDGYNIVLLSFNRTLGELDAMTLNRKEYLPYMFVKTFLEIVQTQFGIKLVVNERAKVCDIVFIPNVVSSNQKNMLFDGKTFPRSTGINAYKGTVLKYTKLDGVYFEGTPDEFSPARFLYTSNTVAVVEDLPTVTSKIESDFYSYFYVEENGFYYKSIDLFGDGVWVWYPVSLYDPLVHMEADKKREVESKILPRNKVQYASSVGNLGIEVPFINGDDTDKSAVYFSLYRGVKTWSETIGGTTHSLKWPVAADDVNTIEGQAVGGSFGDNELSLRPDGSYGLYEKLLKPYFEWLASRKPKKVLSSLTVNELLKIDWVKKQHEKGQDYIIDSIKFDVTPKGISVCEVAFYTG